MKCIIFGAGENARYVSNILNEAMVNVIFIVDNDSEKIGKVVNGLVVKNANSIKDYIDDKEVKIAISVKSKLIQGKIIEQVKKMGFTDNRIFDASFSDIDLKIVPGTSFGKIKLPANCVACKNFDPESMLIKCDDNRFLRIINNCSRDKYKKIYDICKKDNIFGNYVVNTIIVNKTGLEEYLVFEHETITPITYCFEWSPTMLMDYVQFMIMFLKKLHNSGLGLQDTHTLNCTLNKGRFVFLDYGALKIGETSKTSLYIFINTHIVPIMLLAQGKIEKAYSMLNTTGIQYNVADIWGYLKENDRYNLNTIIESLFCDAHYFEKTIELIKDLLEQMDFSARNGFWDGYQENEWKWSEKIENWKPKMKNVIDTITELNPKTVIDLAGNMGWYGAYKHDIMDYCIVADYEHACIDDLWKRVKDNNMKNVYPVYMSMIAPALGCYRGALIDSKSGIVPKRKSALERMNCEMVLALAIVHHMVFRMYLNFEEIVNLLLRYTKRYLLVEWIDGSDKFIVDFKQDGFEWYTKENFVFEIQKKFKIQKVIDSTPSETRCIFVCEKR